MSQKRSSFKPVLLVILGLLVCVPVVWLAVVRLEGTPPTIEVGLESPFIGASRRFTVSVDDAGSGVRRIRIGVLVKGRAVEVLERTFPSAGFFGGGREKSVQLKATVDPKSLGLPDGKATLRVVAWDYSLRQWGKGNRALTEKAIRIDTRPPSIELISRVHNLTQGGSGLAIYRLSEDCPVSGVKVGDRFYPGYAGYFKDPSVYMAFFALDYRQGKATRMTVTAEDPAGNKAEVGMPYHINPRAFRKDTIHLSDSFFNRKMPDFEHFFPDSTGDSRLDLFLKVNRELRRKNGDAFKRITAHPVKKVLWHGPFLRLPHSATRARYADHRTYLYHGKVVDHEVHLGMDLASTAHSPVPAANRGKVVFTGEEGIYGNTIVLDHGFGLFTTYSHLSRIDVTVGQIVEKGQIIGRTGMTGLAGGDHLHYGTLIHQTFVNPVEWWDPAWIKHNITDKIHDAKAR